MPKSTFYNLNKDKKEKIKKAIRNEFSRNPFSKASISNIIEEAQIPRGSFYQYFDDKEDALKYILDEVAQKERKKIIDILNRNSGDIFKTSIESFDYILNKNINEKEIQFLKNVVKEIKEENIDFQLPIRSNFKSTVEKWNINTESLNIKSEEDLKYILRILFIVTKTQIMDVILKRISKEKARENLIKQIQILKEGMTKK